jgi:hypothetical protein
LAPGFYIAHIPLKYFRDISLDLFPGKLLRGRIISSEGGKIRIELGGAVLEASSKRAFQKGDSITLRVNGISSKGVSLEIVETKAQLASAKVMQRAQEENTQIKDLFMFRESLEKLLDMKAGSNRALDEKILAQSLKTLLRAEEKHDFYFMAIPIKLPDNKPRHLELLMRRAKSREGSGEQQAYEYNFSISTARLGNIVGIIFQVGKKLRIDLVASNREAIDELKSISGVIKNSITQAGFEVVSLNVRHGESKGPVESAVDI